MRTDRWLRSRRVPGLVAVLCLSLATAAAAPVRHGPSTGRVTGHVRDGQGAPVAYAQVIVAGSALSALTDTTGRYLLPAVPTGTVTLRATRVGYGPAELAGTVRPGGTLTLNFVLMDQRSAARQLAEEKDAAKAAANSPVASAMLRREDFRTNGATGVAASPAPEPWRWAQEPGNTEAYNTVDEHRFLAAAANPVSTFSIDVDAASYSNVRRFLRQGTLPPKDAVRLEELVNYFPYRYADHNGRHPFAVSTEVGPCPWSPEHRLVRIGLQARRVPTQDLPPSNLVFLIDVSGSMMSPDKLPLVQQAFRALVHELRARDRVAIVVYAGAAGLVLPSTSGAEKATILEAIDRLQAGGSTAGGAGIRLAYDVARQHFDREGNNRVILATDGDFNVGVSSDAEMVRLVGAASRGRHLSYRAGLRDRQPEGLEDGADGRQG